MRRGPAGASRAARGRGRAPRSRPARPTDDPTRWSSVRPGVSPWRARPSRRAPKQVGLAAPLSRCARGSRSPTRLVHGAEHEGPGPGAAGAGLRRRTRSSPTSSAPTASSCGSSPPLRGVNWLVWIAPVAGLLLGVAVVVFALRSPKAAGVRAGLPAPPPSRGGGRAATPARGPAARGLRAAGARAGLRLAGRRAAPGRESP